jgi:hypothetical protein
MVERSLTYACIWLTDMWHMIDWQIVERGLAASREVDDVVPSCDSWAGLPPSLRPILDMSEQSTLHIKIE